MSHRSAPLTIPPLIGENQQTLDEKSAKKQTKVLLSTLQADIAQFKSSRFPPPILKQVQDMPIYTGNLAEVQQYQAEWQNFIERAKSFYPSAYLPPDYLPLPASLEIPQFVYWVQKLHLAKTYAKESKNFGSVGALLNKCGEFKDAEILAMEQVFNQNPNARLVAHREFIDLRAYVFCRDAHGEMLDPQRLRFYRTGLIIHALPGFKLVDSRQTPRKKRNDAYQNPIANNDLWKVFVKH
ncbi:hypothetical protein MOMA_06096 [Moraxella macacae 0408225]|uniref:Uncharacterized protein n=1 Tax=Moraxella macacae 0408225 TaxID=1230338 RepID=L2F500_9GAMM|nr:hypothetical protein [Moraxella macacae]ELA08109.1 hypothetical protein MOMA_06096 [Moraxella macacae 0408225]